MLHIEYFFNQRAKLLEDVRSTRTTVIACVPPTHIRVAWGDTLIVLSFYGYCVCSIYDFRLSSKFTVVQYGGLEPLTRQKTEHFTPIGCCTALIRIYLWN